MRKINVLIIAASLKIGGAEKVARDIALYAPPGKYEFHYIVFGDEVGAYESQLREKGCTIFHLAEPSDNYPQYLQDLWNLMKTHRYDIVHAHNMFNCGLSMLVAAWAGIPVRVVHSHSALDDGNGMVKRVYEAVMRSLILTCATDLVACGVKAGQRLFGKRAYERRGNLILNGIDVRSFAFDRDSRAAIRGQLNAADRFILGHVGHLLEVKNQAFLLDLMPDVLERKPDALLVMLGEGPDRPMLEKKIHDMGLEDHVIMTGNVTNVADYLSAVDVFVFPSLYEGTPLSILEIQANGLPCVISDGVPEDVFLTDLIHPLSLSDPKEKWVDMIVRCGRGETVAYNQLLQDSDYSVGTAVAKIYDIYKR